MQLLLWYYLLCHRLNAPINGMPHLAYLGQMLEKGGGLGIGIFPDLGKIPMANPKIRNGKLGFKASTNLPA